MKRRPVPVRIYAALVRLLPAGLRAAHGDEAADTFHDLYRDARSHSRSAAARLWLASTWHLCRCALSARRDTGRPSRSGFRPVHLAPDVRHSVRALLAAPSYTLTALLIVGVGIGATTTIFSVVDTVVLRQMPYPEAGRLLHFDNGAHTMPSFSEWRELQAFDRVAAATDVRVDLTGEGPPARLPGARISDGFFPLLGAAPAIGRLFSADDHSADRRVAVLGHGAWITRWGGDPSIVGRSILLDGEPTTVVGVVAADFSPPEIETGAEVDVWLPLVETPESLANHSRYYLGVVGRLRPGTSLETAQAQVDAQRASAAREHPQQYVGRDGQVETVPLVTLREATVRDISDTLYLLFGAVGLMLLISCANVASLLLARGMTRSRELALRRALGASEGRLLSLVLTESVVLALAGGALGVALTYGGIALFVTLNPGGIPRIDRLAVDGRVLAFALVASVATGVLFGLLPGLQARRLRVAEALKEGTTAVTAHRASRRTRQGLVVAELALAIVLLVGAGLLFRSFIGRLDVDPGFDTQGLTVAEVSLDAGYDDARRVAFGADLSRLLTATPGIDAVAAGWTVPFRLTGRSRCCWRTRLTGDPALADDDNPVLSLVHPVTHGYFATLGARLVGGREFAPTDDGGAARVSVLNESAARDLFGTNDVVGRRLTVGDTETTVVGIVAGVHHWGLDQDIERAVYVPYAQFGGQVPDFRLLVRSEAAPAATAEAVRRAIGQLDPVLPIGRVTTMEAQVSRSVATPRFLAALFGVFAAVALLLASAGVYGSMLYSVSQRRREMGIRLALGADPARVTRLILRHGLWLAGLGIALGLVAALGASHLMTDLIWGIEPTDPLTLAGVALILGGAALAACLGPAWRAGRTDPLGALRSE